MSHTAVRADNQVKGEHLIIGGDIDGYFAGAGDVNGKISVKNTTDVAQITLDSGASTKISTTGDTYIGGNLTVAGSIIGPANPVAGLSQYAKVGVVGSITGNVWTLSKTDGALGNGLADELQPANAIYLGPHGAWGGSENLIPFAVHKNGLMLIYGATEDYTMAKTGSNEIQITFNYTLNSNDRIMATFSRQT